MKHAREDYNRIQDPDNKIEQDEPVFLLRAQDINAPVVVDFWADEAEREGADSDIIKAARDQADAMRAWQDNNGCKIPDLP